MNGICYICFWFGIFVEGRVWRENEWGMLLYGVLRMSGWIREGWVREK